MDLIKNEIKLICEKAEPLIEKISQKDDIKNSSEELLLLKIEIYKLFENFPKKINNINENKEILFKELYNFDNLKKFSDFICIIFNELINNPSNEKIRSMNYVWKNKFNLFEI